MKYVLEVFKEIKVYPKYEQEKNKRLWMIVQGKQCLALIRGNENGEARQFKKTT